MKIGALPDAVQFRSWKNTTRTAIISASAKPEKSLAWLREVEEKSYDQLSHRGSAFSTLDIKIASALLGRAKGELGRKMTLEAERTANAGVLLKGRQLLHMVYEHFSTHEKLGALYSVFDISKVALKGGDSNLESFLHNWNHVITGLKEPVEEAVLQEFFLRQVEKSTCLKVKVEHYNRQLDGHADKTYAFLYQSVERYLERTRKEMNREQV